MIYIYSILNKVTNKAYIGKTINPNYRWSKHKYALRKGNHINNRLQNSFNKHGESVFEFFVIYETDDHRNWGKIEELFISLFNTTDDKFGYNIGRGGESNMITKEIQEKQKQSNKDRWPNVIQIDMSTLKRLNTFQGCSDASKNSGIGVAHINDVCNLKHISAGGFYWCYEKNWSDNWMPPLHKGSNPVGIFRDDKLIKVIRNRDGDGFSKEVSRLYKNKIKPVTIDELVLKFITHEEYYNFVLNLNL